MLQLLLVMQVKLSSGLWQKLKVKVEVLLLSMILVAQLPVKIQLPGEGFLPPFAGPRETRLASDFFQRSEEHTSELQSLAYLVCRLLLEKKKKKRFIITYNI